MAEGRTEGEEAHKRWAEIPKDEEGQPREVMATLPPEYTCACFDEIAQGYTEEQAQREAERCLNCGVCSECMQCVAACQAGAIDHSQKPETKEIKVGAVILSPGFQTFDPVKCETYHYASLPNVVTSLEFERILSASGPFGGHLVRPSDHKEPKKIAWLQCVGSRDVKYHTYCSSVCCMYAIKEAVIAKEHAPYPLDDRHLLHGHADLRQGLRTVLQPGQRRARGALHPFPHPHHRSPAGRQSADQLCGRKRREKHPKTSTWWSCRWAWR